MGFLKGYATGRGSRASSFERGVIGLKLQGDARKEQQINRAEQRAYITEQKAKEQAHGLQIVKIQEGVAHERNVVTGIAEKNREKELALRSRKQLLEEKKQKQEERKSAESARLSEMQKVRATPIRTKSKTSGHKRITTAS